MELFLIICSFAQILLICLFYRKIVIEFKKKRNCKADEFFQFSHNSLQYWLQLVSIFLTVILLSFPVATYIFFNPKIEDFNKKKEFIEKTYKNIEDLTLNLTKLENKVKIYRLYSNIYFDSENISILQSNKRYTDIIKILSDIDLENLDFYLKTQILCDLGHAYKESGDIENAIVIGEKLITIFPNKENIEEVKKLKEKQKQQKAEKR